MCIFTRFRYLCLHEKFKIAHPCDKASLDRNGVLTCPDDPNPRLDDGKTHMCGPRTYGIGVCGSIHCAWYFSILPIGDYGDDKRFGNSKSFEDDTEIVDSPEAREDRVARWYHLLNADQQLDHYQTEYPLPYHKRSTAGRALQDFPYGAAVLPLDTLQWQELNPICLDPAKLQWAVFSRILPASVVDGRKSNTISPVQPTAGPFKLAGDHKCPKKYGICKKCGMNIGDPALRNATLAHRQIVAFQALRDHDRAQPVLKGTVWDPSVDLVWDDEKGDYCKVATTNHHLEIRDPPNPVATTDFAFAPSTAQPIDSPAAFHEQSTFPLAEVTVESSMQLGFPEGMDWQDFAEASTSCPLVAALETTSGALYWPDLESSTGNVSGDAPLSSLSLSSQKLDPRDPFYFDPSISYDENFSATADQIDFSSFPDPTISASIAAAGQLFNNNSDNDGDISMEATAEPSESTGDQLDDLCFHQFPDPAVVSNNSTATTTFPGSDYVQQVENFIAEQQVANDSSYRPSAATMTVLVQMVRQAAMDGGFSRMSYDEEANALFEMMMQHAIAGIL